MTVNPVPSCYSVSNKLRGAKVTLAGGRATHSLFSICVVLYYSLGSGALAFTVSPYPSCRGKSVSRHFYDRLIGPLQQSISEEDEGKMMDEYERQSQAFRQVNPSDFFTPKDEITSSESSSSTSSFPRRVKTRLGNLLSGMPSLVDMFRAADDDDDDDFLADDSSSSPQRRPTSKRGDSSTTRHSDNDDWFHDEKHRIMNKYDAMLDEMVVKLQDQQRSDPDSVPENAQALMKYIFKEEMEKELIETRDRRAKERIKTYGAEMMEQLERQDLSDVEVSEDLQILMDETQEDLQRREATQRRKDDFYLYEREATRKAAADKSVSSPVTGTNMDLWALDRLEEMAESKLEAEDSQDIVDMLKESAERLRNRLQRESEKDPVHPESMKEWQMYRSIATRLAADEELLGSGDDVHARQQEIIRRLDAWKAYVEKEASVRKELGLTRGPQLPFEWHEVEKSEEAPADEPAYRTRAEARKEINRMSIKALESLLSTVSSARRESLQKEIAYMKSVLEPNDYLDIDESLLEDKKKPKLMGPVDLRDIFTKPSIKKAVSTNIQAVSPQSIETATEPIYEPSDASSFDIPNSRPPPPNTPFFSQNNENGDSAPVDSKLGDMEEQKLQSMFRKAGARTRREQDEIRQQYEDYKRMEDDARQVSGLAGESTETLIDDSTVDITAFVADDGSIDAEKVLRAIGPRPSRTRKSEPQPSTSSMPSQSSVDEREMADSRFSAVAAVGGGRYKDDPDASAKIRAPYDEFVERRKELRKSLDDEEASPQPRSEDPSTIDDVKYAEDVLNTLGPRPTVRRQKTIDEGLISDRGGILAYRMGMDELDDGENDDDDEDEVENADNMESNDDGEGPTQGLRGQILFGADIDDDLNNAQHSRMSQLQDYEQRRGRKHQLGIGMGDAFGRDHADYEYDKGDFRTRQDDWGEVSFKARKESLLDYVELDAAGLNSLMDHKDSIYSTGVSQYLPLVNKPFSCFGAIFRLEGVLLDLTGLQMKAWTQVADEFGFKAPEYDDVLRAAVLRPDIAIKEAFYWTNDVVLIRDAVIVHKKIFRELFEDWADCQGVATAKKAVNALVIGADVDALSQQEVLIGSSMNSWLKTAAIHAKPIPSQADLFHAASLDAKGAVTDAFRWTSDVNEANDIVETYKSYLKFGRGSSANEPLAPSPASVTTDSPTFVLSGKGNVVDENAMMEIHYHAWQSVAVMFDFTPPSSDGVLSAFVVNDPAVAVDQMFRWTDDDALQQQIVAEFRRLVDKNVVSITGSAQESPAMLEERQTVRQANPSDTMDEDPSLSTPTQPNVHSANASSPSVPSQDEIFRAMSDAWKAVALKEGREPPSDDQVMFAMSVGADAAVVASFGWANDLKDAARFVDLYMQEISVLRERWNSDANVLPVSPSTVKEIPLVSAASGAAKWIESLLEVEMSCAIVSFLESDQVEALLQYAGLANLFPTDRRISLTNGYKDDVQQLLGAALRVERRPDHCVVFDSTPHASLAAHEVDMRSVNLIGHFPKYELLTADSTTASFDAMTAMDIRRLFSERVFDQPQTESLQPITNQGRKTITQTDFWEDERES